MADDEVSMLKILVGEQAAQLKVLSDLGHYLVQAHFAVRERHLDLMEQHSILVSTLCRKGVVSNEDLLQQARASRPTKLLCCVCSEPQIAGPLVLTLGIPAARCLLVASQRFASGLGWALEQFQEAARYFVQVVAHCEERSAGVLGVEGPAGEESARDGFLALLQEVWQYNMLAESISCAMGLTAFQQFRAVSRAGRECMRSVHSRTSITGFSVGEDIVRRIAPPKAKAHTPRASESEDPEPPDAVSQALALLQHLWQDMVFAETLKSCMGDASVRAFRTISRAGRECMRSFAKRERQGEEEAVFALVRAGPELSNESSGSDEGPRRRVMQASKMLTRVPDNFMLFLRSQTHDGGHKQLVQLCNLRTRTELNGVVGKVTHVGSSAKDRWQVALPTGETILVRQKNCQFLPTEEHLTKKHERRRELKWAPKPVANGAAIEMHVLTSKTPAREIANFLDTPCVYNFVMVSASVRDTLAVTGKLYICGGVDHSRVLSSVECFDLHTHRWADPPPPPMMRPRGGAAYCMSGGYFWYAAGSSDGSGWLNTLERFDPWSGEWKVMPPMKTARIYASMVSIEGRLYICGGHTQHNVPVSAVERFDPENRTWKEISSMLDRRTVPMANVADSMLYVYGGVDHDYLCSLERYDPSTEFWQRLPPMSHCRSYAGSTIARGCLYVCGGTGHVRGARGTAPVKLQAAERYNVRRTRWEELPQMRSPRSHNFVVVRGDILFSCGGCMCGRPSVEALDLKAMEAWEVVGPPLMQEWTFGVVTTVAEHIYVLGGRSKRKDEELNSTLLNSLVRYSMSGNVWEELPSMNAARTFAAGFHSCI